jgi:phenylacetate-CoA ligase
MSDPLDPDGPLALAEYVPGRGIALTDAERWPTLDDAGRERLAHWRDHPDAPAWVHATGDRLNPAQIARVRTPLPTAGWLDAHLATARRLLHYRARTDLRRLEDFPTVGRADLVADIAAFVPLDADLERLVEGTSSGSTGAALRIPDDIEEVARGFHLLVDLVRGQGVEWQPHPRRMALVNLVHQTQAFTYVSVISSFDQRAMARLNLHPGSWPAPGSRARYLAAADPQVVTGNPTSLAALLHPDVRSAVAPLAIFSGAMALSAPLRAELEDAFACPVFDVYGLHETRPIAVRTDDGPFRVLDRRVHVEVLAPDGSPVPDGQVGEIVVTAGENPLLPLVRYRTGDFGRRVPLADGGTGLADLEGREHSVFAAADGSAVSCVDLTQQLQAHGARGWAVAQDASGAVTARIVGGDASAIGTALQALLGRPVPVTTLPDLPALGEGKPRRYLVAPPASAVAS